VVRCPRQTCIDVIDHSYLILGVDLPRCVEFLLIIYGLLPGLEIEGSNLGGIPLQGHHDVVTIISTEFEFCKILLLVLNPGEVGKL